MKVGDEVWYTIPGDEPRKWTITSMFDTHTEGFVACLSRPDDTKKLGVDRCNASLSALERVSHEDSKPCAAPAGGSPDDGGT
jgi:hypothetical protein